MAGRIGVVADEVAAELRRRLPGQRRTQRYNLAMLVATMLEARSANLMDLAAVLPRDAQRADIRYQWITRVLGNPLIDPDAVMAPFASEVLRREAEAGYVMVILDRSKLSDRHEVIMLAVRQHNRTLPLAWRVQATKDQIEFTVQRELIQTVISWLPQNATVWLVADSFEGTSNLIWFCRAQGWGYRLRLQNTPSIRDCLDQFKSSASSGDSEEYSLGKPQFRPRRSKTNVGSICEPAHREPCITAIRYKFGYFPALDNSQLWYIENMFSMFHSHGFGIEHTRLRYPDRLARLLLIMALALYHTMPESCGTRLGSQI